MFWHETWMHNSVTNSVKLPISNESSFEIGSVWQMFTVYPIFVLYNSYIYIYTFCLIGWIPCKSQNAGHFWYIFYANNVLFCSQIIKEKELIRSFIMNDVLQISKIIVMALINFLFLCVLCSLPSSFVMCKQGK